MGSTPTRCAISFFVFASAAEEGEEGEEGEEEEEEERGVVERRNEVEVVAVAVATVEVEEGRRLFSLVTSIFFFFSSLFPSALSLSTLFSSLH